MNLTGGDIETLSITIRKCYELALRNTLPAHFKAMEKRLAKQLREMEKRMAGGKTRTKKVGGDE